MGLRFELAWLALWACSGAHEPSRDVKPSDAAPTARDAADPLAADPRRWFAGDVHMHVSPPDDPADVTMNVQQIARAAATAGLDFVVLTPHVWQARWESGGFRGAWRRLAADAAQITTPTMIPGAEWSDRDGHFTVTGVDLAALPAKKPFLAAAHDAGAFISTNHPFAVPTRVFGIRASHFDMSYRPWSERRSGFTAIDGAEVWNIPLGLANLVSRPGGRTGEERAWTELDRVVHDEHRRVTAVAGTDNHRSNVMATTWVLAVDATASAILDAITHGATCVGGPEAGSFRAHGDGDWVRIGEAVVGKTIALAWNGTARLFIDDVDQGEHAGGFVHDTGGRLHTYRIAIGPSRSGFIYANLPGA